MEQINIRLCYHPHIAHRLYLETSKLARYFCLKKQLAQCSKTPRQAHHLKLPSFNFFLLNASCITRRKMESSLINFSFVYIRSIRVVELEVVMRSAELTKDSSTLLHPKAGASQFSSSSAEDTFPSVVTPPITATTKKIPFTALSPYRKYWSIQGRASTKTSLKTYNNVRGSGKVFGFDLINRDKEEIHLFAFAELAESLYNLIQVGQLYIVSNGTVKKLQPPQEQMGNLLVCFFHYQSMSHR